MASRVIEWLSHLRMDHHLEPEVHFHAGPGSTPAVCFDERCPVPRLDV